MVVSATFSYNNPNYQIQVLLVQLDLRVLTDVLGPLDHADLSAHVVGMASLVLQDAMDGQVLLDLKVRYETNKIKYFLGLCINENAISQSGHTI